MTGPHVGPGVHPCLSPDSWVSCPFGAKPWHLPIKFHTLEVVTGVCLRLGVRLVVVSGIYGDEKPPR